jgi:hypothetical protein
MRKLVRKGRAGFEGSAAIAAVLDAAGGIGRMLDAGVRVYLTQWLVQVC